MANHSKCRREDCANFRENIEAVAKQRDGLLADNHKKTYTIQDLTLKLTSALERIRSLESKP